MPRVKTRKHTEPGTYLGGRYGDVACGCGWSVTFYRGGMRSAEYATLAWATHVGRNP